MEDRAEEAWDKAATCQANANESSDRAVKRMFRHLRDSWIRIGNNSQFSIDADASHEQPKGGGT